MITRRLISLGAVLAVVIAGGLLTPIGETPEFELTSHLGDCENDGIDVGFTTEFSATAPVGYRVTEAEVRNIDMQCNGGEIGIILRAGTTDLASGETSITGTTMTIPVSPNPLAEEVDEVYVELARAPDGIGGGSGGSDVTPPAADVAVSGDVFSPNGDGRLDTFDVDATFTEPTDWVFEIVPADGGSTDAGLAAQAQTSIRVTGAGEEASVRWDGLADNVQVPEGTYSWTLNGTDTAGNAMDEVVGSVTVDRTAVVLLDLKAPERFDLSHRPLVRIRFFVNEDATVTVKIKRRGNLIKTLGQKLSFDPTTRAIFKWDGTDNNGKLVPPGRYVVKIRAVDRAANRTINRGLRIEVIR